MKKTMQFGGFGSTIFGPHFILLIWMFGSFFKRKNKKNREKYFSFFFFMSAPSFAFLRFVVFLSFAAVPLFGSGVWVCRCVCVCVCVCVSPSFAYLRFLSTVPLFGLGV